MYIYKEYECVYMIRCIISKMYMEVAYICRRQNDNIM